MLKVGRERGRVAQEFEGWEEVGTAEVREKKVMRRTRAMLIKPTGGWSVRALCRARNGARVGLPPRRQRQPSPSWPRHWSLRAKRAWARIRIFFSMGRARYQQPCGRQDGRPTKLRRCSFAGVARWPRSVGNGSAAAETIRPPPARISITLTRREDHSDKCSPPLCRRGVRSGGETSLGCCHS